MSKFIEIGPIKNWIVITLFGWRTSITKLWRFESFYFWKSSKCLAIHPKYRFGLGWFEIILTRAK